MTTEVVVILMNSEAVNSLDYFRRALENKKARVGWAYVRVDGRVFSLPAIHFPVKDRLPEEVREKAKKMLARYPGNAEYLFDTGEIVEAVAKENRQQQSPDSKRRKQR